MTKYLLFASSLLVSAPLLMAQVTSPATPATPATPAVPKDSPAVPATPATPADPAPKDGTRDPTVSGEAKAHADFAAFDVDGNGKLSKDEARGKASINFQEMDRNVDGNISRAEFESSIKSQPKHKR
jgi:hypothetical protein